MNEVVDLRSAGRAQGGPAPVAEVYDAGPSVNEVVDELNRAYAFVVMGAKAAIVEETTGENGLVEDRFLTVETFKLLYGNRFVHTRNHKNEVVPKSWGAAWLSNRHRRTYTGVTFMPDPALAPVNYYNLWRGFAVEPVQRADAYPTFRQHLWENVCGKDKELYAWHWAWWAALFQRPATIYGSAIAYRGKPGAGKSKVGDVFGRLLGRSRVKVDKPEHVTGHFNNHLRHCLLLQVEEGFWAGDKKAESALKNMISTEEIQIEPKGLDIIRVRNLVHMIVTSNEDWVVPVALDDRRWFVLDVAPTRARDVEWFGRIDAELESGGYEALLWDLLHFDLSPFNLRAPPMTAAKVEQKIEGLEDVHKWWYECLWRGWITRDDEGWPHPEVGIAGARLYDSYLAMMERQNVRTGRSVESKLGKDLRKVCPDLQSGVKVWNDDQPARRVNGCKFPSLDLCRAAFERAIGQPMEWPEIEATGGTVADD